ncbi:MAG TPA: CVNH domain-containing protein [Candidatus Angelobacter sp.]
MRRVIMSAVCAMVCIFLAGGTTCLAQGGLPYGSYRQTCQNMRVDGNKLFAYCRKADGGWRNTSIDYRSCGGEIINDDGYLRCGGGDNRYPGGGNIGGWRGGLPPGDYKRTCQNMRVNGNKLYATCQTVNGGWHDTSLNNFNLCQRPIANDNGNLRCPK